VPRSNVTEKFEVLGCCA